MDTASLAALVETSRLVGSSRSRIAKIEALAAFLRTLAADEIGIAVAWLTGELGPLAQTAADVAEALAAFAAETDFEWKMDGARIQVHKRGTEVRIYTRALNEVGAAVPEVVACARALPADELILDGEAIAFTEAGRPYPFQITMRRFGRRLDVGRMMAELPIRAFFFDCLLLDGRALIDLPLRDRLLALGRAVPEALRFPQRVTGDAAAAQRFYDDAITAGHEGVMAKSLASVYEAGNGGASGFKIKRAHTLDLVVLGAEWATAGASASCRTCTSARSTPPPAAT